MIISKSIPGRVLALLEKYSEMLECQVNLPDTEDPYGSFKKKAAFTITNITEQPECLTDPGETCYLTEILIEDLFIEQPKGPKNPKHIYKKIPTLIPSTIIHILQG